MNKNAQVHLICVLMLTMCKIRNDHADYVKILARVAMDLPEGGMKDIYKKAFITYLPYTESIKEGSGGG